MKLISEKYINKGEGKVGKCKYYRLSHFTETCCFRFYPNTYLTLSTVNVDGIHLALGMKDGSFTVLRVR